MEKIAIVIFADTNTSEAIGKVSNSFILAMEAIENGDDLKIIFDGAGTKWIGELEKEDHKLHRIYLSLKGNITGACKYCARAYGVIDQVENAGLNLIDEYKNHPSLRSLIVNGYHILSV